MTRSILADLNGQFDRSEDWMWQPAYTPAAAEPAAELTPASPPHLTELMSANRTCGGHSHSDVSGPGS